MAPGTEGSLVAALIGSIAWYYTGPIAVSFLFAVSLIAGFWTAPWFIHKYGQDPGSFVMDEWAGQLLALQVFWIIPDETQLAYNIALILLSFIVFRFFDILKPLGIKRLETYSGAFGVMADDLLAGFYTFLTLFFVILAVL